MHAPSILLLLAVPSLLFSSDDARGKRSFAAQDAVEEKERSEPAWVQLFDGQTLHGWTRRNGTATYTVRDGAIVGRTTDGSPNSFLCTDRGYSDFELRFKVKVDNRLNSGVQIRSNTRGGPTGRVNGPQVEIEASAVA